MANDFNMDDIIERENQIADAKNNVCQNCGKHWAEEELEEITHGFWERVAPGEIYPSGECPECGALCTPDTREVRMSFAARELLAACKSALKRLEVLADADEATDNDMEVLVDLKAAIRKAEGAA